jgi:hypothetical protein
MYVLGNSINTLAGNYQVRRVPPALLWSIEILTLVVFVNWRPLRRSSLAALASMLFFLLTSGIYLLLMRWNIFVDNTFLFFGTSIYLLAIGILDDLIDFYRWLRARIKGGPRGPDALDCPSAG